MNYTGRLVGLALGLAIGLCGCVTSGQGEKMQKDIDSMRERVEAMDQRDTEINQQVERLRKVLDQATALLQRNSADVGAKTQKNESDIAALGGQIEEAKHILTQLQRSSQDQSGRLAALEQTQGKIVDRIAPNIPEDKEQLWAEAQRRIGAGQREEGRRMYTAFVQKFGQDPRAPQARLLMGQSYASEGKHSVAVGEYGKVIEAYPKSPEVADATWLMSQSYTEMKLCAEARALLQDLIRKYPKGRHANDAKQKLKELARCKG